ncbi:MAG: hypothetical protein MR902_06525, partial [Campylobacter sp.]|nr:hypothetical protein [Campylobacter sp.]
MIEFDNDFIELFMSYVFRICILLSAFCIFAFANILNKILQTQSRYEDERFKSLESQKQTPNIIFDSDTIKLHSIILNEKPCFKIDEVRLVGDESYKFKSILDRTLKKVNFKKAVKKFKEIVGEDNVIDNQKDIYLYRDAYSPEWDEETEPIPSLA